MTSYMSEIVVGSAIVAALGVAAYMVHQPRPTPMQQEVSALHAKAWGKQWPQFESTIDKTEISNETGSVDDDDDEIYGLADKLVVPPQFQLPLIEDILVIREEYEMLCRVLEDHPKASTKSIVVTGHPGIGKSTFLLYLLLYRLEKKLPTAIQFGAQYYFIFDKQGATVNSLPHRDPRLEKCWALTDSNEKVSQPCEAFEAAELVVLASPPEPERWRKWKKQRGARLIISDLPSVPEIAAVAKEVMELRKEVGEEPLYDPSSTLSLVSKWGPSTRNILRSMEFASGGDPIQEEAEMAVGRIWEKPSASFEKSSRRIPQSECSSVIFLRRAGNGSVEWNQALSFIPTPHLLALFEVEHKRKTNKEHLELFYALSSHALTRDTAGWAHEISVHDRLGNPGVALSIFRGPTERHMQPSTRLLPGTLDGLKKAGVADSFYWIPSAANFPGVDSVLGDTDRQVYTIQATIAHHHKSPLEGIKKVWAAINPLIRTHTWHFVIITDSKEAADAYKGRFSSELSELKLGESQARVQFWTCALES